MTRNKSITPGYFSSLWRFMASLKLTVFLLLCLAGLSIIGTIIPQNISPQDYVRLFGAFRYQLFVLLDIVDMYHSWWFTGLLLFLVINIIVCSIDRLQTTGKIIFTKNPKFNLDSYRKRKHRHTFQIKAVPADIEAVVKKNISRHFGYVRVVPVDRGFAITAEKGRWTRLGVYVVHLSIVVLLLGGLIGSKWGFDGSMNLPEGDHSDTVQLDRSGRSHQLPFSIRCDDFNVQFYEGTQRPKEFRASLTILDNGTEVVQRDIIVNDPLYYKGVGIYMSSYGPLDPNTMPKETAAITPTDELTISIRSKASGMIYNRVTKIGQSVAIPEGLGKLVIDRYEPDAKFKGMELGPALNAILTDTAGNSQTVTLPLKFPKFDAMRKGAVIISVASKSMQRQQQRYYAGLKVVNDPGVSTVYAGFLMMIIGCAVAFFMSHQQVVVEVISKGNRTEVSLSGKAHKNKVGYRMKMEQLADKLAKAAKSSVSNQ